MRRQLTILFLLLFSNGISPAQEQWKLSTEKEGIKIYTSLEAGSKIKAVKVECELQATPTQLVAVLLDVKSSADWIYHTKSCSLIKQVSPSELYYYSEINLPWPAENRDFIAHLTVHQDAETKVIMVDGPAIPGFVPVKAGIVRIAHSRGKWVLTPGDGQVKIVYILQVDPGGDIPAWLVNLFASDGPLQIFRNLKEQVKKPAYQNVSLPFIRD